MSSTEMEVFEKILRYFVIERRNSESAQCKCPAHNDNKASLTITKGDRGIKFYCHAGCSYDDIIGAAGIETKDTFYNNDIHPNNKPRWLYFAENMFKDKGLKLESYYHYYSIIDNSYAYTKLRFEGKKLIYGKVDFQEDRFKKGLGRNNPRKSFKAIYGDIKSIKNAIKENKPIFIVEGEKDVDTLIQRGYIAFTYGSCNDWQKDLAAIVKDANVYILADNDKQGKNISNIILCDISNEAKNAKIILPAPHIEKGDISDYFNEGHTKEEFEQLLKKTNVIDNVFESIEDKEKKIKEIVNKLRKNNAKESYGTTDKESGALFSKIFENEFAYNPDIKEYMYYNGQNWKKDVEGMRARRSAKLLVDALKIYANNKNTSNDYRNYIQKLDTLRYRTNMIIDAKDNRTISNIDLDSDDLILNCQNGIVLLKKNNITFLKHDADYLLSKICNAKYNSQATCEKWNTFVNQIMQGNQNKIRYLQKVAGLSLTGITKEETMFILYGSTTRNGKSTFVETLSYLLGDYATTMRPESLAAKLSSDGRQANGDIARLKGVRFVNANEPPKKMLLDSALIKTLIGRDVITARHIHERDFEFIPVCKLMVNTNYLPQIIDDTLFSSGRINVISFDRHFEPHEQNRDLKDQLKEENELSGILNWCIEGLKMYYEEGLKPPKEVQDANAIYRQDSDKIGKFISEMLTPSKTSVTIKEVYEKYKDWCNDYGFGCENKSNFISEIKRRKLYEPTGTIGGKTVRNVIKNYEIAFEPAENTPFNN